MPALLLVAVLAAAPLHGTPRDCSKTFTAPMVTRAIDRVYGGTENVSQTARRHLRHYVHCARQHVSRVKLRRYLHRAWAAWQLRRHPPPPPMYPAIASWYDTEGVGACGFGTVQTGYRFASLILPCGAVAEFCHGSACIEGVMSDHGPYVGGRTFDFNVNMRDALGCGGICAITWRRVA